MRPLRRLSFQPLAFLALALGVGASPLAGQTSTLHWSDVFPDLATVTPVDINGITFNIVTQNPFGLPTTGLFQVVHSCAGAFCGYWRVDVDFSDSAQYLGFTMTFSKPVRDLTFTILDLDFDQARQEEMDVVGWRGGTPFAPTAVTLGAGVSEAGPGLYRSQAYCDPPSEVCDARITFGQPVDSVVFVYGSGPLSPLDPSSTFAGISDLTWRAEGDLVVTQSAPALVDSGSVFVYTVTAHNDGPAAATTLVLSDTLPAAVTIQAASDAGVIAGSVVTWPQVDSLLSGGEVVRTVTVRAPASGTFTAVAAGVTTMVDTLPGNNDGSAPGARATTTVLEADVSATVAGPTLLSPPGPYSYTVTVHNAGPTVAQSVIVTDTLPTGPVAFVSASGGGVAAGGVVTWTLPSLAAGATVQFTVAMQASVTTTLLNVVAATSATPDPVAGNNDGSDPAGRVTTSVVELADVEVSLAGPALVVAAGGMTYTIRAVNAGPNPAADLVVTLTLPAAVAFNGASDGGLEAAGVVTWPTVAALAPGDSVVHTVTATAPADGTHLAVASAASATADPAPGNNDGSAAASRVQTLVTDFADLVVRQTGPASVPATGTASYKVVVRNDGPSPVTQVNISDTLPSGAAATVISDGGAAGGGVVVWPVVSSLAPGDSVIRSLTITPPPTGSPTLRAVALAVTIDSDSSNNVADATTVVLERADVVVELAAPASADAGKTFLHTVTLRNDGPSDASGVVAFDTLSGGPTVTAVSDGGAAAGNVVSWPAFTLAAGVTVTRTVTLSAPPSGAVGGIAAALAATTDPDGTNNDGGPAASRATSTVVEQADLVATVSAASTVVAGDTLGYRVVVRNAGPSTAAAVTVTDTLPAAASVVSVSDGGTVAGSVASWPATASLPAGDSLVYRVVVRAPPAGTLTNVVAAGAATADPDPGNNDGSATTGGRVVTAVSALADLVVLASGPAEVPAGASVTYRIVVHNVGPSDAADVAVMDTLPAGMVATSTSAGGVVNGGVVTWSGLPSLAAGDSAEFELTGTAPLTGVLVNLAAASSSAADPVPGNNDGSADASRVTTLLALDLRLAMTATRDTMTAGDVGVVPDSVAVTVVGSGADTTAWSARGTGAPWLTLTTPAGVGSGALAWQVDVGQLRVGSYTDTLFVQLDAEHADTIGIIIDVIAPAVDMAGAIDDILGTPRLTAGQRRYLDQEGNGDGVFNLGDLLAYLDRTGVRLSAELAQQLASLAVPPTRKEP